MYFLNPDLHSWHATSLQLGNCSQLHTYLPGVLHHNERSLNVMVQATKSKTKQGQVPLLYPRTGCRAQHASSGSSTLQQQQDHWHATSPIHAKHYPLFTTGCHMPLSCLELELKRAKSHRNQHCEIRMANAQPDVFSADFSCLQYYLAECQCVAACNNLLHRLKVCLGLRHRAVASFFAFAMLSTLHMGGRDIRQLAWLHNEPRSTSFGQALMDRDITAVETSLPWSMIYAIS